MEYILRRGKKASTLRSDIQTYNIVSNRKLLFLDLKIIAS